MSQVDVNLGYKSYPIHIGQGGIRELPSLLHSHAHSQHYVIITDENVHALYHEMISDVLRDVTFQISVVTAGEGAKSIEWAYKLYTDLIQAQGTRKSVIIALGGGVIGDLAGFVAATFLRGIRLVQIPTTLLAQVDSSVGGKVGINHELGKNLIGAFHQPEFVLIDPSFLTTLPPREVKAGFAEVVKYGLIRDRALFNILKQRLTGLFALEDMTTLANVISRCCQIKADVVQRDERELGLRAILNFGHTIGHALEAATHYRTFLHGEAVLYGMIGALWLSTQVGFLKKEEYQSAITLLEEFAAPAVQPTVSVDSVLSAMMRDKKRSFSGQMWVLLNRIGESALVENISESHVRGAIDVVLAASALER